jgi:predicted DNA-binding protein YlxM (UPF0122 family)
MNTDAIEKCAERTVTLRAWYTLVQADNPANLLLLYLLTRGYREAEIARKWGVGKSAITNRVRRIKDLYPIAEANNLSILKGQGHERQHSHTAQVVRL